MTSRTLSAAADATTRPAAAPLPPAPPLGDHESSEEPPSRRPYTHAMIDFLSAFLPPDEPASVSPL